MAQRSPERSSARKLGGKAPKAKRKPKAKTRHPSGPSAADLRRELSRRTVELAEAREQQAATTEVLQIISSSRGELGPVFEASQLDTADRQEPTEALAAKVTRLTEKLTKLKEEMGKLAVYEKRMLASPDQQISLTDPDSRSMATSGRGSGVVGYNVQVAVDTEHHLIVAHEVTNSGSDRAQLANMAKQAKGVLKTETLEAVADRGYFSSPEILACHEAGITVTLPKPQTSGAKSEGRFGKQDFAYLPEEDAYRCPAGERLPYRYTNEEDGKMLRRYWTTACQNCSLKSQCTTGPERRITRWEHEHLLEAVQQRLDSNPQAMRQRRETVEHPFGTMKARMGATHFLTKTLPKVAAEMALSVLAYNLTRVMNIVGTKSLMAAIVA
jgi:Transposase DDE domain